MSGRPSRFALTNVVPERNDADASSPCRYVVLPHHPERIRRPAAFTGERTGDLITWNVFRTLELIAPAFWLRRLCARLGDAVEGDPAPTTVKVTLWPDLPASPALSLSAGGGAVTADVLIETEHSTWALVALAGADLPPWDDSGPDPIVRLIDAGTWHAGARDFRAAVLVSDPATAPRAVSLVRHYATARAHVLNRLPRRTDDLRNLRTIGLGRWGDLRDILADCACSSALGPVERLLAQETLDWFTRTARVF